MPFLVMRHQPTVFHIGHLEPGPEGCPDKGGLAVTASPEEWRAIHGANGPEWELHCSSAQWVDMLKMTPQDHEELQAWMMLDANRYMVPATAFTVQKWCDVAEDFVEHSFTSLAEAAAYIGKTEDQELADRLLGQGAVEDVPSFMLQRRALRRLAAEHHPFDWFTAAAFLYTREVVLAKRPFAVGLWWAEPASRAARTAPHGILMPEALIDYSVESDDVDEQVFTEAFPDWQLPRRKVPLGEE